MRIATVIGARPQFIKAAVLSRLIQSRDDVTEILIHTGQHYDARMSDVFFEELALPRPDHFLGVGSGPQAEQTGRAMIEIERVLLSERPELTVVYGDTNSTLAGGLAAAKLNLPVAHVEAGLRSFDRAMPEEVNRCLTDHLSAWHFCPTDIAVANLHREGITANVHLVGDVMCDALRFYSDRPPSKTIDALIQQIGDSFVLCTLHRAGNTDDRSRFQSLWQGINRLSELVPVILPLHPRTRNVVDELQLPAAHSLHLIEPVGFCDMLALEARARLIVTDSGGVQKEAYLQGVPCLTMRENTEWTETVETGWNRLVGDDADRLLHEAQRILDEGPPTTRPALYGDGTAGERILDALLA